MPARFTFSPFAFTICLRVFIITLVCTSSFASAQTQAESQIDILQQQLREPSATLQQRAQLIQQLFTIRNQLLQRNPNERNRAIWLADHASDIYFSVLLPDSSHLVAMFGVPSQEQRAILQQLVSDMHESAQRAEREVHATIAAIDADPTLHTSSDLQQQRRELSEVQRDRRIPFLLGIAAYLQAEVNAASDNERKQLWTSADRLLSDVHERLDAGVALEARLYAGLAKARLGQFDAAEQHFGEVARQNAASAAQVFMARMGGVINRTVRSGAQAGLAAIQSLEPRYVSDDPANTFFRVLLADQKFLLRKSIADAAAPEHRQELLAEAFQSYTDLLRAETAAGRDAMRAIIFSRLVTASDSDLPLNQLPSIVTIARADQLSRAEATRAHGIDLLEQSIMSGSLDQHTHATALFVLGRALRAHSQPLLAAQRFIELADRFPADAQAQRAIELGVAIAAEQYQQYPNDAELRSLLTHGLDVLLKRYPNLPSINHWRLAAARLARQDRRFDYATELLQQITPDSQQWADAHFLQVELERDRAASAERTMAAQQRIIAAIDRVQPILRSILNTAAAQDQPAQDQAAQAQTAQRLQRYLDLLEIYRADAMLQMNQPQQAIDHLDRLTIASAQDAGLLSAMLKVRINAYQALKQPERALQQMQRLAEASPETVAAILMPMITSMRDDVQALLQQSREDQARDLANRTLLPAAQLFEQHMQSSKLQASEQLNAETLVADAYRLAGRSSEALDRYDRALARAPHASELLLGRAESLYAIGGDQNLADAMNVYKRLAAAGPDAGHEVYWRSQLRMLQILDRVGRNVEQIVPRIERLRQQDQSLGGDPYQRGFESLRLKHAMKN